MKLKIYFVIVLCLIIQFADAQIGIGTTTPRATLDILSSNQAAPANIDGILIPRVDTFPATNPTASQNGMLVFLTTVSGANQPRFYYWNNASSAWVGINSTVSSDADWYKVGTTTAPTLISDNMFHTGNVAIGKNTANYPLEVTSPNKEIGINTNYTNNTTNAISNIGINNQISGSSTDVTYGLINDISGSGASGAQFGTANSISNSGNSNHHGTYNSLSGSGSGSHYAIYNDLTGSGTGSNKLYIENSSADANGALIYGEFDNNIVRVNGEIQIGNPTVTGYAFPTSRVTNLQVLQTNGSGATSWVNTSSLAITETDPQVSSATNNTILKWNGTT
jgi:hypothetical protein